MGAWVRRNNMLQECPDCLSNADTTRAVIESAISFPLPTLALRQIKAGATQ